MGTEFDDAAFGFDDLDFGIEFEESGNTTHGETPGKDPNAELQTAVKRTKERHLFRRAASEQALEKVLDWHLETGYTYHIISAGNVDSLSYLKMILRQEPLEYCILSTWCLAMTDAVMLEDWLHRGFIKRLDLYVGEIFQRQYDGVYSFCASKIARRYGGRVAVFRNHAKVMAGFGPRFSFAIESSANIDTNPRTEQTAITVTREIALFYKRFYDGITSFNRDFDDWKPYQFREES